MIADWYILVVATIAPPIIALFVGVWINRRFENRPAAKRGPILFSCAIASPVVVLLLAARVGAPFEDPPHDPYTALSIFLYSAVAAVTLTCALVVWGWTRGERPRLLAPVGPFISIWFVWRLLFT